MLGIIHCDSKNDSGNHQILHHLCECCSQALFSLQPEKKSDEINCKVLTKVQAQTKKKLHVELP